MHPKFTALLRCPVTGSELELKADEFFKNGMVKSGILAARDGNEKYPVINGIPRFVAKEFYSGSFGYEWRKWPRVQFEAENAGRPMQGHTTKMFKAITQFNEKDLAGAYVVEFGCGPGRFLDVVRKCGSLAVGIDMSLAVEAARENFRDDENVLIVQGDILNPPFKKGVFDFGYTAGVLHHTPDPGLGLKKLAEVIKPAGRIACCVYSKKGFYNYPSVFMYRQIHRLASNLLGVAFSNKIALGYSYFAAYILYYIFAFTRKVPFIGLPIVYIIEKFFLVNLHIPDIRWRILDVFDAITPRYASTHTSEELQQWFEDAGCAQIQQSGWGDTSFVAIKK